METPTLPAVRQFADEIRALYAKGLEETELWQKIAVAMRKLLADPTLKERAQGWPATVESAPTVRNLLFYEDPDYGFVFNATVRKPNVVTNVHDHGNVWTLYGLIEGRETYMYRYERTDGGLPDIGPAKLELVGRHSIGPGDIERCAARRDLSGACRPGPQHRLHRARPPAGNLPAALLRSDHWGRVDHPWAAADRTDAGVISVSTSCTRRGANVHGTSFGVVEGLGGLLLR